MKLLEQLTSGDVFSFNNLFFVLTIDYKLGKTNDYKRCISLSDGSSRWIESNALVDNIPLFTIDHNSNLIPIKETKK